MSDDNIDTRVSADLHPDTVRNIEDYDDETRSHLAPVEEAFTTTYTAIQSVWDTKAVVEKNSAWTDDAKLIQLDAFAGKHMERLTRQFDSVSANLAKSIASIERDLTTPVESRASVAVASEIRKHCKELSTGNQLGFIEAAIKNGDETTIGAILGAPAYLSGLTAEMQSAWTKVYRERSAPTVAKRLRAMVAAKELLDNRGPLIFSELERAVGAPPHVAQRLRAANTAAEKALIMKEL